MEMLEEAVTTYETYLGGDVATVQYLLGRGLTAETAQRHRLGVVGTEEFGHWYGRLAIPYLDHLGRPVTIRFRCLQQHKCKDVGCPKYLPITGDPSRFYNVGAIHRAKDEFHLTEGEFDAQILEQVGFHAGAIPGAHGFQNHHRRMLAGFNKVWVWGDPDAAGAQFIDKVTRGLRSAHGIRPKVGDVTETFLAGGADALHALVEAAR